MLDLRSYTVMQRYLGASNFKEHIRSTLSACGSFVISGSEDGYAHVWNTETGQSSQIGLNWYTINNEYGFLFGVIGYFHFHFIYIIDGAHYFKPCGCSWASSPLWFCYYYTVLYFFFIVAKNKLETWSQRSNHQYLDEKLESVLNYLIWPC